MGVRFKEFYAYSTCTPSRAAFFTGKPPSRSGIVYPIQHDDNYGIPVEFDTLPEVLKCNGYQTALIGKWHLGVQPEFVPQAHGFDYHYGIRGGWVDQYSKINPVTGYDWYRNDAVIKDADDTHITDLLTRDALSYIESSGEKPFFLCLSYTAPHVPIQVDEKWAKPYESKFDTKTRVGYAGMMAQIDDSISQIVESLQAQNLLENTIIVFFSDNGPSSPGKKWYIPDGFHKQNFYGNDGQYGDVGDLKGWKASPYEGGIKVPAFLYWKGHLADRNDTTPAIIEDFYPTILGLLGIPNQSESRDILNDQELRRPLYWRTPKNLTIRDDQWKLILHNESPWESELNAELYAITEDPNEIQNVMNDHPEVYAELLSKMKVEFESDPRVYVNEELLRNESK